jgi:type I restriction enzyme M protein
VNDDNILFIDASAEFEKGKNQNFLSDDQVDKIVEAYKKRENIDKYAHVVSLDIIKENDFNLNIPRYVDTFEEEELIDLELVANKLKALETDMRETDRIIKQFCTELNITYPV